MNLRTLSALFCTGCAALGVPFAAQGQEAPEQLILAVGGEPDTGYDPLIGWGAYGHPLFQSTLLRRNADLEIEPDLATDWSLSADRLVWTVTIRDDVVFSDGTPLTAADVAFTFNAARNAGGTMDMTVMESAEAIDDTTVEITLSRPWVTFTESLLTLGIVPEASYDENYGRNPVGSGPFQMVSWTQGEQLIVERNPHYYGDAGDFERLVFSFTDEDTSFAAASAGQVHMISVPAPLADSVPQGYERVSVDSVDNRGILFPMQPSGETTENGLPVGNDVTADIAIRKAVNLGLDRELLVEVALFGHGEPAYGPADGLPWSNPEGALAYDPDEAVAVLEDAGWAMGDDGVRVRDGRRASFTLNYPSSDSTRQALAVTASELLREIGVEAVPNGVTWDEIDRIAYSEPVVFGWGNHSPLEVYNLYHSSGAGNAYFNAGYYDSEAVDAALEAAQGAASLEESYPFWQDAEWDGETGFSARGDAAWAWLVNLDHVYFVDQCLDLGALQTEPHGHGWPITAGIANWEWTCE